MGGGRGVEITDLVCLFLPPTSLRLDKLGLCIRLRLLVSGYLFILGHSYNYHRGFDTSLVKQTKMASTATGEVDPDHLVA